MSQRRRPLFEAHHGRSRAAGPPAALHSAAGSTTPFPFARVLPWVLVALLAGVPFTLGKYLEFSLPGPYDSGAYVYSAYRVLHGARLGIDEVPSAKTGTLLVNMLGVALFGFNETGPKVVQMVLQAVALIAFLLTLRRVFGMLAASVAATVASIYLSCPLLAKFGNVKEQFMIAFMILAVCGVLRRHTAGRWWWTLLAGALAAWAPLCKETGLSVVAAIGLFTLVQPLLKHRTWRQTGADVGLLLVGAVLSVAPVWVWLDAVGARVDRPYATIWRFVQQVLPKPRPAAAPAPPAAEPAGAPPAAADDAKTPPAPVAGATPAAPLRNYAFRGWESLSPEQVKEVVKKIFRFYGTLNVPVGLAAGAILARLVRLIRRRRTQRTPPPLPCAYDRFVLLLAVWWLLDMAFVWISPRSYEEYYLPLTASGGALGAYLTAVYRDAWATGRNRRLWLALGGGGLVLLLALVWPICFGLRVSPHTGRVYTATDARTGQPYPSPDRGYKQSLADVAARRRGMKANWEILADYIGRHSAPADTIYVWGWYPGIYVCSQRLSDMPRAFESEMHTMSPAALSGSVAQLVGLFTARPPKYIVDTCKWDFPFNRPPFELWPRDLWPRDAQGREQYPAGPPPADHVKAFERDWARLLAERFDPDEAVRFAVMGPFRNFIMDHYRPVPPAEILQLLWGRAVRPDQAERFIAPMVLYELKPPAPTAPAR